MKLVSYYIVAAIGFFFVCINNTIISLIGMVLAGYGLYKFGRELGLK